MKNKDVLRQCRSAATVTLAIVLALFTHSAFSQTKVSELPLWGNFYSLQNPDWPPLPCALFPELPLYSLGDGVYAVDDRSVDYGRAVLAAAESSDTQFAEGEAEGGAGFAFGPGLKLTIPVLTNGGLYTSLF